VQQGVDYLRGGSHRRDHAIDVAVGEAVQVPARGWTRRTVKTGGVGLPSVFVEAVVERAVDHLAGDAAKGLQFHQPGLRLMDIPRNASGFGPALDAGFAAVELVETVGGGEGSWTRHLHQRAPVLCRSFGVTADVAKLEI
jgi:hypothetical protein